MGSVSAPSVAWLLLACELGSSSRTVRGITLDLTQTWTVCFALRR